MKHLLRFAILISVLAVSSKTAGAAVSIVSAFLTTAQADSSCNPGGSPVTSYPSTAAAAWLYVEVSGAAAGDKVSVDWFDPNGKNEFTNTFQPLTGAGTFCFSASLNIAGTTVATLPGNWTVRVTYNGSTLTTLPFSITGSSGGSCVYAVNPLTVSAPTPPATAAGGTGAIVVSTLAGCAWTATSNSNFLTINAGSASGSGNGNVNYTVAANTTSSARTGTMTIAGQTVTISQAAGTACAYALNPTTSSVSNSGGSGSFNVSSTAGCAWAATPNATWISISSGGSGSGPGTVNYSAAANTGPSRTGTITVAGQTFTLTQDANQITPGGAVIGFGPGVGTYTLNRIEVTRTYDDGLTAANNIISPGSTTYPAGTTSFQVGWDFTTSTVRDRFVDTINLTNLPQTVTPTVNATLAATATGDWNASGFGLGRTHTYEIDDSYHDGTVQLPIQGPPGPEDGVGSTSVSASYTKPAPAALNDEVRLILTTALNFGNGAGTGQMEIDFVYTSCASTSITPPSQQPAASGGTLTVPVTATAGCTWSANVLAGSPWLTASPATGNGNGSVTLTAAPNSGASYRGGVVNIAGQLLAVMQAATGGSGTYTLNRIQVTRTYDSSVSAATANPIQAGMQTFQGNGLYLGYQAGWDYTFPPNPGDPLVAAISRNRFVGFLNFDGVPTAVTPGSNATVALDMMGDWVGQDFGIQRFHTLSATGAGSGQAQSPNTDPDGTGLLTFNAPGPAQAVPQPNSAGEVHLVVNGRVDFQDAGGVSLEADLVYTGGGTGPTCSFTLGTSSGTVPQAGGTGSFTFTASSSSCAWTAATAASFLTITSASSGTGSGTVSFSATANTTNSSRTGTITVGGQTFTVTQAGVAACTFTVSPLNPSTIPAAGGSGAITVTASASSCVWAFSSNSSFLHTTFGTGSVSVSGPIGSGTVNYSVDANTSTSSRTGTLTVAGQTVTITQAAAAPVCTFSLTPATSTIPLAGGGGSFSVGASGPSCTWTATAAAAFLSITPPATGTASGTVNYTATANTTGASRTGTITVGMAGNPSSNVTETITQPGANSCVFGLTPNSQSAPTAGGSFSVVVGAPTGCLWTAVSNNTNFLTIIAGGTGGNGDGNVSYTVSANSGSGVRNGSLTIANVTFPVTQAGSTVCSFSLNSSSASPTAAGGPATVPFTASAGTCAWTAASNVSWAMLTGAGSGIGSGTLNYTVQPNTGPARSGTLTVAGQTFTVNQGAAAPVNCTFTLAPSSATDTAAGGTGTFAVNPSSGSCNWTATPSSFVTITANPSGTGSGMVGYSVPANTGAGRSATIVVGGQTFTINQAAAPPVCTVTLPVSGATAPAAGGSNSAAVNTGGTCTWSATSNASWIILSGTATGTGNGNFNYTVAANTGPSRTGTIAISGQTFTVTQSAGASSCQFTLDPASQAALPGGGPGQVLVIPSPSSCSWTATSNNTDFISITSGASGTGPLTLNYSVTANTGSSARNGSLTIGSVNFPITQSAGAAPACNLSLSPGSVTALPAGGPGQVAVTTDTGCTWQASTTASWITITPPGSGNGAGTVNFTAQANTGTSSRDGVVNIGSQTFTVHQQAGTPAPCTYALNPASQAAAVAGGADSFGVTAPTGCAWTASNNNTDFLTVTSGTGNGNGAVNYAVTQNTGAGTRTGTITVQGQTFTVTQPGTGTTPTNPCAFTLNPTSESATAAGGPAQVLVTTSTGCSWQATSNNPDWISITTGAASAGNGTVNYSVQANTTGSARSGSMTIGGNQFPVTQPANTTTSGACPFTLNPSSQAALAAGGPGQFTVNTQTGCTWQAATTASWISITSGGSQAGSGTVNYTVAPNTTSGALTGTITVGTATFTITQSASSTGTSPGNCSNESISPYTQAAQPGGGASQVTVTAPTGCTWTATSNTDWLTVTNGGPGAGNGTVTYSVAAYTGATSRTGTITIAGQSLTVTQSGVTGTAPCTYSFDPPSQSVGGTGGPGQTILTTNTGCAWTATSDSPWLTITTGTTGNSSGLLNYAVAPYPSGPPQTGNITVNGTNFQVTQTSGTGQACTFTLNPASEPASSAGGTGQVAVTVATGCTWNATSNNADWLTITAGGRGNGSETLSYSVAANTGAQRTGTITIATGTTFSVTQDAGSANTGGTNNSNCTYSLTPTSQSAVAAGGSSQFTVTTATGCTWTATSNNTDFLSITSSRGSGGGTVTYSVGPNSTSASRTGTITVANQTFTVTQAGTTSSGAVPTAAGSCNFTLSPSSGSATSNAGSGQVQVTAPTGCPWSAVSNNTDWLTITDGASGGGNGTVTYAFAANTGNARTGSLTIGGVNFPVSQSAPGAGGPGSNNANCNYSLNPTSQAAQVGGGQAQIAVTASSGCTWTATSNNPDWLSITGGASGNGPGTVDYNVQANSGASTRTGTLTVANTTFQVTQAGTSTTNTGCNLSLNPQSQSAAAGGGTGTVMVTAPVGCPWTATSGVGWISVVSGASGSGPGSFTYSVQANTTNASQTGTVTVGNASFTVTQAASGGSSSGGATSLVSNCNFSITPSAQSATAAGGSGNVAVSTTLGCSWTTSSSADWLVVTAGGTGSGSTSVTYSVSPNSGATRTGTLAVAGQTFTVTQAGTSGPGSSASGGAACNYSLNPASQSASAAGGADTVSVLAPVGCAWTAVPSVNWISITSGASGSSSGTVNYSAGANSTGASRTGAINIAGQTVNITQGAAGSAGGGCTYSLSSTSQQATSDGGTGQVAVVAGAGCAWSATSSSGFITIASGGSGSGNGTLSYTVAANTTGNPQTGTLTVAGQTLTITQAAAGASGDACTYTINPASQSEPGTGGSGQTVVTAPLGCSWLATSGADWLTVIDAGTGQGNGVVTFGAAANSSGAPLTGAITIGGQTLTITEAVSGSANGPQINVGGVVNAASFAPPGTPAGAIAQGSFMSIFGSNMGPTTPAGVSSFPLGTSLAGVSIQITQGSSEVDAIPHYVSAGQINAILPSNAPLGTVQITVTYQGAVSNAITFQVAPSNWGTFSNPSGGAGPGIIQNVVTATQYDLNTPADSATPGQIEIVWGTGLGAINGPDNVPPPVGNLPTPVQVMVGGVPAAIAYSGRTPCCSAVDNIYFTVPAAAPLGCAVPVQVILNGSNASNTVTMAISKSGGQCN